MKQTAVEWFNEKINNLNVSTDAKAFIADVFNKANEMFEQQIIDAYDDGNPNGFIDKDGEQYYNETFKK